MSLVGALVSAVAGFGLVIVVTNLFPTDVAGRFFTATSLFLLLSAVAVLGTETGLGRFVLAYESRARSGDVALVLRAAFVPTLLLSAVLAVLLWVTAGSAAPLIGLRGSEGIWSLRILAVLLPFMTLGLLSLAGTRAYGRMRTTVFVDKFGRSVAQPLLILAAWGSGFGLVGLTIMWSVPYAVAGLIAAVLFHRYFRARRGNDPTDATRYHHVRAEFWSYTWPRSVTRVSQLAIQRLDIILVAAMRSPTEAAIYTAATRFVGLGQFGSQAIQQVLQPKFTWLLANDEHDVMRDIYRISTAWSMAICWPLYLVVGCAPFVYLGVFGPEYEGAVWVVLLMVGAMLFGVASGPADTLLLMAGRSRLSLMNSLVALTIDVVLCVVLIPRFGITGAAVAWAIANVVRCGLAVVQVGTELRVVSVSRASISVAVICLMTFVTPLVLVAVVVGLNVLLLAALLPFCLAAYAIALYLNRRVLMLGVLRGLVRGRPRALSGS